MATDTAVQPLAETAAETAERERAARAENEAEWRLDRLVLESDKGQQFGIAPSTVMGIRSRRSWKHVA